MDQDEHQQQHFATELGTVNNWSGSNSSSVPGIAGDTATLGSATTNNQYINLDQNRSVGAITFNNSSATSSDRLLYDCRQRLHADAGQYRQPADDHQYFGQEYDQRSIALNGSPNITMTSGTLTLSGVISNGSSVNGLTLSSGSGTVVFSGTNTYGGGTTVDAGILQLGSTGALPPAARGDGRRRHAEPGRFNQANTVGAVSISSGSIGGVGILTGTGYTVTGGTISANLAAAGPWGKPAALRSSAGPTAIRAAPISRAAPCSLTARRRAFQRNGRRKRRHAEPQRQQSKRRRGFNQQRQHRRAVAR